MLIRKFLCSNIVIFDDIKFSFNARITGLKSFSDLIFAKNDPAIRKNKQIKMEATETFIDS